MARSDEQRPAILEDATATPADVLSGPVEQPITLAFNDTAYASVLASPEALEHWALGFAWSEGMITRTAQVRDIHIDRLRHGVRVRLTVPSHVEQLAAERRRVTTSASSCGRCGSAEEAQMLEGLKRLPPSSPPSVAHLNAALEWLEELASPGMHMALALDEHGKRLGTGRDIGRHNALDKLIGAGLREGRRPALVLISSRCSLELVQKAVRADIPTLATLSLPSNLAVDIARLCALNLICCHRGRRLTLLSGNF
ncbi:formate dehydrogenase accessory sulfurtransferase FdhD [Kushneria phosphatilytica]|uniref:Formate dehydrogenase accessory sulfurtransferase FdhD n=1 Tax=Kushneria phosphatilytica TaxID=657387 RepID=A0A1S1NSE1_9GAMM|nr:formate dehydrogenase accessory sulfurtransferase FdhD [Kushneria phosphatilytica]OHV07840.1 formate dehydrogenase accessory protein FdhD [Kushneria phosphatilytica]QEL10141.1 formate dehydrogenase accessory sulfurtransferase FdhD [Kushneria phosphatilytica]